MFKFIINLFRFIIFLVIVSGLVFIYARYIEPQMLKVSEITIHSGYLYEESQGLTIAVFADTHFGDFYTIEDFTKVQNKLEEINPDIVIFAGDLIDHYDEYQEDVAKISEELSKIKAPLGKFAIFGNHDYGGGAEHEYENIMEAGGFTILQNEYFPLDELGMSIIGIDDVIIGYGNPKIASWARPDYFNIILTHAPDVADQILEYNGDLIISAHTHGRQVGLNFFDDKILPPYGKKYIKGLYELDNHRKATLYVNRGVGMTQLPLRFLSPPELTVITVM
ncbi:MAG: metallophosphoesterase [Anaerovoracaceae bacterium]|jgi:predicted MPP superfamily phosphohydrolase